MRKSSLLLLISILLTISCQKQVDVEVTAKDYHAALDKLTEVMVYDIFSPPVASRVYVYPSIAAYEVIATDTLQEFKSLKNQIPHYAGISKPEDFEAINLNMAAIMAYLNVGEELIFSTEKIKSYRDSIYQVWKKTPKFEHTLSYANKVSQEILDWASKDNYAETRTMPKFSMDTEDPSRWLPTPPDYMNGIEPSWMKMRTIVQDSASIFKPKKPTEFSMEEDSQFYKELIEVYNAVNKARTLGDNSEMVEIAKFWDCNPYVSTHKGHMMFATKKITPGAHWILINKVVAKKENLNFAETSRSYALLSIGIYEAFISSWDEKYRSNLIRPETLINKYVDADWTPILQTPPFPEHTSGHSVVSAASSVIMTHLYGENYQFDDATEVVYGLPVRSFNSFNEAAEEAAISRLYGGIHYMPAIKEGLTQGRNVGRYVIEKIKI